MKKFSSQGKHNKSLDALKEINPLIKKKKIKFIKI